MTEEEKKAIYGACEKFVSGHEPRRMKDRLADLASATGESEAADVYGRGALIENFESEIANQLGKPAALFLPSGTMAQLIALRIWCDAKHSRSFAMHATSHLALHERDAYKHLYGLEGAFIGEADRSLEARDFSQIESVAAAIVELPHRELGGVLPSWTDVVEISETCRRSDVRLHLDGARLWESAPYYEKTPAQISALFDSVYVSFYKGLGGITGAALAGPVDFIEEARVWQRRAGGNLYRLYPYVISAREALKLRLPRMRSYAEKAREIARVLTDLDGVEVRPPVPHINMMHVRFKRKKESLESAFLTIARERKILGVSFLQTFQSQSGELCQTEITVGDATMKLSADEIASVFREALKNSV